MNFHLNKRVSPFDMNNVIAVVMRIIKINDFKFFNISLNGIFDTATSKTTDKNDIKYDTGDFEIKTVARKTISDNNFILGSVLCMGESAE